MATSYGSITIVDITDIGEFSVQPMANRPLSVVYDSNTNPPTYTPDWSNFPLTITPSVYYAGQTLPLNTSGLTIMWSLVENAGAESNITYTMEDQALDSSVHAGVVKPAYNSIYSVTETGSEKCLYVDSTRLQHSDVSPITLVTYIVSADYLEPNSQTHIKARGQITFSLVENASNVLDCVINGTNTFKYNSARTSITPGEITLTSRISGGSRVNRYKWEYKNGTGDNDWAEYPTGDGNPTNNSSTTQLIIKPSHNVFKLDGGDRCLIRLRTTVDGVISSTLYDLHEIIKLYDGAAGEGTIVGNLTNDDQSIPFTAAGVGDFSAAQTQLIITEGGSDVTNKYSIQRQASDTITIDGNITTTNVANDTVKVNSFVGDATTGNVTFTATRASEYVLTNDTVAVNGVTYYSRSGTSPNYIYTATSVASGGNPQALGLYILKTYNPIIKVFSVLKVSAGAPGVTPTIYSLEASAVSITGLVNTSGDVTGFNPSSITFYAYKQEGNIITQPVSNTIITVWKNTTYEQIKAGTATSANKIGTSSYNQDSTAATYTLSAIPTNATSLLGILYEGSENIANIKDHQSVGIAKNGQKGDGGDAGPAGESALNIIFKDSSVILKCDSTNKISSNPQRIVLPFSAVVGTNKVDCSIINLNTYTIGGKAPNAIGTSATSSKNATTTSDGQIVWDLNQGREISAESGNITITFRATVAENTTRDITKNFSWVRQPQPTNGINTSIVQIYPLNGKNVLEESDTSVTLRAELINGGTNITQNDIDNNESTVNYQWYKWDTNATPNPAYTPLSGKTGYNLTVYNDDVQGYASYKCRIEYPISSGKYYEAFYSVFDHTDPLQVFVSCTLGEQIKNKQGVGAIYVKITKNNQPFDELKSEVFQTTDPAEATSGDYYYKLDTTNKSIILRKYNNSWSNATGDDLITQCTYTWTWRDKNGQLITSYEKNNVTYQLPTVGKVIYIDGDMINQKIVADVTVTLN